jgi:hypothetical protein
MTQLQTINLGSYPNDGTGDDLRTAFLKVNSNFQTLFSEGAVIGGTNLGSGTAIFSSKNTNTSQLEFKTLVSDGSVIITNQGSTIRLAAITNLQSQTSPALGGDLNLNGHNIAGGDVQTTVFSYDMQVNNNVLSTLIAGDSNLDFGTLVYPTGYQRSVKGYSVDFNGSNINGFANPLKNDYDLGSLYSENNIKVGNHFLTLGGNLTTTGGNISVTASGVINLSLATGGTVAVREAGLNQFISTTSAQLASIISDATGSGNLVFNNNPIFSGTLSATNISTGGYIYCSGNFAVNGTQFEIDAATGNTVIGGSLTRKGVNITPANFITISNSSSVVQLSSVVSENILIVSNNGLRTIILLPDAIEDGQICKFTITTNALTVTTAPQGSNAEVGGFILFLLTAPTTITFIYSSLYNTWFRQ